MKPLFLLLLYTTLLLSSTPDDAKLKELIGNMLIVGFDGEKVNANSQIIKDIQKYHLGGVILFDKDFKERSRTKNISSPTQLKKLTHDLKKYAHRPLFISTDQEGGKVARLKPAYGFAKIPSAKAVGEMGYAQTLSIYKKNAKMLHDAGINMNFAPVVDLSLNPKNRVIVGLNRSYGKDATKVSEYAKVVIKEQKAYNIISVLKHFPGHGSSFGDSHEGVVDVSKSWSPDELLPYSHLIAEGVADVIMTAHIFNRHIDALYPATLSYKFNTKLLREMMHFRGVIISDDLQMGAIAKHYTLQERTQLAINAGVDILLFGNQLQQMQVKEIVESIFKSVKSGKIPLQRILESNRRIQNLHTKYSIIQKPILFGEKRVQLTKKYIKNHYALQVNNIKIIPKIVVVHWTAVPTLQESFKRLYPEELLSDRADIASASALNVSAHFLVDRDGSIYELMPDNFMARHVIGLNYSSIGIENVGGANNEKEDLTQEQLQANIRLINYLKAKYPTIQGVIGHFEYRELEGTPLWLEKDAGYRTKKVDPGKGFIDAIRAGIDG